MSDHNHQQQFHLQYVHPTATTGRVDYPVGSPPPSYNNAASASSLYDSQPPPYSRHPPQSPPTIRTTKSTGECQTQKKRTARNNQRRECLQPQSSGASSIATITHNTSSNNMGNQSSALRTTGNNRNNGKGDDGDMVFCCLCPFLIFTILLILLRVMVHSSLSKSSSFVPSYEPSYIPTIRHSKNPFTVRISRSFLHGSEVSPFDQKILDAVDRLLANRDHSDGDYDGAYAAKCWADLKFVCCNGIQLVKEVEITEKSDFHAPIHTRCRWLTDFAETVVECALNSTRPYNRTIPNVKFTARSIDCFTGDIPIQAISKRLVPPSPGTDDARDRPNGDSTTNKTTLPDKNSSDNVTTLLTIVPDVLDGWYWIMDPEPAASGNKTKGKPEKIYWLQVYRYNWISFFNLRIINWRFYE